MLERVESLQDAHSIIDNARTEVWKRAGADRVWDKMRRIAEYIRTQETVAMQEE